MRNIVQIFKSDLTGMVQHFFVLVIVGGLCLLPALYAWFNIYSNWDPYGSTGNIKIAVVNLRGKFNGAKHTTEALAAPKGAG
jgi:putative membrane protein